MLYAIIGKNSKGIAWAQLYRRETPKQNAPIMSYWHDSCKKKEIGYIGTYIAYKKMLVYLLLASFLQTKQYSYNIKRSGLTLRHLGRKARQGIRARVTSAFYPTPLA